MKVTFPILVAFAIQVEEVTKKQTNNIQAYVILSKNNIIRYLKVNISFYLSLKYLQLQKIKKKKTVVKERGLDIVEKLKKLKKRSSVPKIADSEDDLDDLDNEVGSHNRLKESNKSM